MFTEMAPSGEVIVAAIKSVDKVTADSHLFKTILFFGPPCIRLQLIFVE